MAHIHLIGGEKGGVGKSLVARLLAQYMIDRKLPFISFDSDRSHGALMRFYAGYALPVRIDSDIALDGLIEAALDQPSRRVLVDLAAQTHQHLRQWIEGAGVLDLAAEHGLVLHYWHVMDNGRDGVQLLGQVLDDFGSAMQHVLVRNQLRGDDFSLLDASSALARAQAIGARSMDLKHLNDVLMHKIDARNSSFWAASQASDKAVTGLGLMDRQRLKVWLRDAYAGFDAIGI